MFIIVGGKRVFYSSGRQKSLIVGGKGVFCAQMAIERDSMELQPLKIVENTLLALKSLETMFVFNF